MQNNTIFIFKIQIHGMNWTNNQLPAFQKENCILTSIDKMSSDFIVLAIFYNKTIFRPIKTETNWYSSLSVQVLKVQNKIKEYRYGEPNTTSTLIFNTN